MGLGYKCLRREYIVQGVEQSLKRLQVDAIDLYQSHWDDDKTPFEETLEAYSRLLKQGKVKAIGASNLTAQALGARPWRSARSAAIRVTRRCSRSTICTTAMASKGSCRSFACASNSASSPTSRSPPAFSRANIARRRISPKASADEACRSTSIPGGCASSPRSMRCPSASRAKPAQVALAWLVAPTRRHRAHCQRDVPGATQGAGRGDAARARRRRLAHAGCGKRAGLIRAGAAR